MKGKKANIMDGLGALGIGIATLAIILVVTFLIMAQAKENIGTIEGIDATNVTQCQTSVSCNATTTLTEAVDDIPGWVPLIVITVIGALLLSLVAMFRR